MAGAGKSVLAAHLSSRGLPMIRFGEIVVDEVKRRGLALSPANERTIREEIRETHGMDVCAKLALPRIKEIVETYDAIVIDGLYSFSEYITLRSEFENDLIVVAVFTSRYLRYQRLEVRVE